MPFNSSNFFCEMKSSMNKKEQTYLALCRTLVISIEEKVKGIIPNAANNHTSESKALSDREAQDFLLTHALSFLGEDSDQFIEYRYVVHDEDTGFYEAVVRSLSVLTYIAYLCRTGRCQDFSACSALLVNNAILELPNYVPCDLSVCILSGQMGEHFFCAVGPTSMDVDNYIVIDPWYSKSILSHGNVFTVKEYVSNGYAHFNENSLRDLVIRCKFPVKECIVFNKNSIRERAEEVIDLARKTYAEILETRVTLEPVGSKGHRYVPELECVMWRAIQQGDKDGSTGGDNPKSHSFNN
jgi:hypothetical protein